MKLLSEINVDEEIVLKEHRKTSSGHIIIDFSNDESYQTCWLELVNDVDNNICVNAEKIKDILFKIDDKIKEISKKYLEMTDEEMKSIYIPIIKSGKYLILNIGSNTVLFEGDVSCDNKNDIKNKLKKGNYVRFILNFKKVNFKYNEIKCLINVVQIEKI
jgi:hypothetical protein